MRYSVLLEPINEPEFQGYYYAHIPTLDLTTHGQGIEGAIAAAQELIEAWVEEKRSRGESVYCRNEVVDRSGRNSRCHIPPVRSSQD